MSSAKVERIGRPLLSAACCAFLAFNITELIQRARQLDSRMYLTELRASSRQLRARLLQCFALSLIKQSSSYDLSQPELIFMVGDIMIILTLF